MNMNMKKKIGICATLLATLLCALPQSAHAYGKIRSVDVYDPDGNRTFPNPNAPLTVGDTIYVRFRLANLMWAETTAATTAGTSFSNPWYFAYTGTLTGNETLDELTRIASQKPRLGLWISGRVREAECIDFPGVLSNWLAETLDGEKHYTELTFKYTIQAGDFALPVQLANASGTGPASGGMEPYYLKYEGQPIHWALQSTNTTGTVTSEFSFGPPYLYDDPDFPGDLTKWETVAGLNVEIRDLDLRTAGVYVQAIDFDKTYADQTAGIWRTIAKGSTTANPGVPTVSIEGGAATPMTLYVWAESNTVAEVTTGGQVVELTDYDFGGGVTRKVGSLRINAGDTSVPLYVKATGNVGDTTKVFLSATPTNIYNQSNNLITNFITRTIEVGEPLPPSISVTVDGAASKEVTAPTNHTLALVAVNVQLSDAFTSDIDIPIQVTLKNDSMGLDPTNYVGLSTRDANNNTDWTTTLRVRRNQNTATASLWMYANRGSVDSKSGLIFSVDTNSATWASSPAKTVFSEFNDAIVYIKPSNPELLTDMTKTYDAVSGLPKTFEIDVLDAFGEREGPYTIKWAYDYPPSSDADYTSIVTNATRSGDFESTIRFEVPISMTRRPGIYTNYFHVVNQDGGRTSGDTMVVWNVKNPLSSGLVCTPIEDMFEENVNSEQNAVKISFADGFSMPERYLQTEGYLFLIPLSEEATNLVYCQSFDRLRSGKTDVTCDWQKGLKIENGKEEVVIKMAFLDGSEDTFPLRYQAVIRTHERLDQGQTVAEWGTAHVFEVNVVNVEPTVKSVSVGGRNASEGESVGSFSSEVEKEFSAKANEPSNVDYLWDKTNGYADHDKSFATRWEFYRDNESNPMFTTNVFGPPTESFTYKFDTAGEYTVKVSMRDKDMVDWFDEIYWGEEFTFSFTVVEKPSIVIEPKYGTVYFSEYSPDDMSQINVTLTTPPTGRVLVELTIDRDGPYTLSSDYPVPNLSKTTLEFKAGETTKSFQLRDLDGTQLTQDYGFLITAAVTNETLNADGVMWKKVYLPGERNIYLKNKEALFDANKVAQLSAVTNKSVTIYQKVPPLSISFNDPSLIDMRSGKTVVEWTTSQGYSHRYTITNQTATCTVSYSDKISFSKSGFQWVTLTVKDKDSDDWTDSVTWYFEIQPTRQLYVTPGYPGSPAADVAKGRLINGTGYGRVWVQGDNGDPKPFSITRHRHLYTCDGTTASVGAFGYKANDVDNGSLTPPTDWPINQNGYATTAPPYYENAQRATDGRDSFMYMWFQSNKGEKGFELSRMVLDVYNPLSGLPGEFTADLPVELLGDDKETATYPDTYVDAIFSREYLVTDNIGDINQDHIPDLYAVTKVWRGNSLFELVGGSIADGMVEGDLFDFYNYNEDADYLPSNSFEGGIPSTANGWSTLSVPFDAELEVRGFHEGLNHRTDSDGLNLFVRGTWVSDPCFSEAETNAVAFWNKVEWNGAVTTWADFKAAVPTDDPDYATKLAEWQTAFRTALDKNDSWIPEKRTNPTLWDTDNDSLPDGYEYYFWYRAAVGEMKDGKWVQLTGEKFTLNNIAKGTRLSAEDIMKAFDPTVKSAESIAKRDTDNDGLTDLEEFAMGTNPVHWDSDGDGMSDLWEVMRGMNPLKPPAPAETNADGDFMARNLTDADYAIVTLNNGKVYALPQNGTALGTFEAESFDADDGTTKGGTNVLASVVFGAEGVSNVSAIAVFHYGDDSTTCVPKKRGNLEEKIKPLDPEERTDLVDTEVVSVRLNQQLMLVHDQVYNQFDFHPCTGWANAARYGSVNTVPYNCTDEYRVMKYRYETGIASASTHINQVNSRQRSLSDIFLELTTNPNKPFAEAAYTISWAGTDGGGGEQVGSVAKIPTYSSDNHGADTDEDGIPDGWELYIGANPNNRDDAIGDSDNDGLILREEYAGSDSSYFYRNAKKGVNGDGEATIYQYHPGMVSGWYNKFTPTNPFEADTDGDGVGDAAEGGAFIYDMSREPDTDDPRPPTARCIRGGGLNPCTVDTDGDFLPDAWEHQYQGMVVPAGTGFEGIPANLVQIIKRNDNLGSNAVIRAYISYGMDGTYDDAYRVPTADEIDPRTGTHRNLDFDNDGLHNFQEYLVQTLRHLRYDDTETPLMGSYLPDGIAGTRKYIGFLAMQTWDGAEFFKAARAAGFSGVSARQAEGFQYDKLGYFAPPARKWDLRMPTDDEGNGNRILMPPRGLSDMATADSENRLSASRYVGTDPRNWDSDNDGMDDYYELFHGLNPILGGKDLISEAYGYRLQSGDIFGARCNAWNGWTDQDLVYDAMRFPWAMGVAEADADADGLRNTDEALLVNMPNPPNYHTDPTPLWMTDSSSKISFTAQYYMRDAYDLGGVAGYPWFSGIDGKDPGSVNKFMFTFEENEGYDTDHDWIPDEQELTHAVTAATSPIHGSDPDRRQAMYFPGAESVVQTYSGNLHRRVGENYAMLRAFSVEAWVRPEDLSRDQTIVTRVCDYPASTLSNATHQVRANFRIKMEAGGRVWGQYDSDDAVPNGSPKGFGTTSVEGNTLESNKWSHVALTFDGNALILYINGREVNRSYSNLIPANGLIVTLQEVNPNGANFGVDGYATYPSALLIGADAAELGAITIGPDSAWTNYCAHYMGWVDEVRVWDGARTAAEITADYMKRYTLEDVAKLRDAVYKAWLNDGTHNPNDGHPDLPTELVFHYGFQQLPSEIVADYVVSEPSGFTEKILDNVKWNGHSVDIRCGWWNAIPIASTVYGNRAIVPWIRDTCAMLPMLDGSTYDSRYWSDLIGGVTFPTEVNVQKFLFPNIANPYPYWNYMGETFFREQRIGWMYPTLGTGLSAAGQDVYNRLRFGNRTLFVGGSDLLPLGGAFAKRCPDFWDGNGATDAWTATADDTDNDGLPDWWEAHAETAYGADAATLNTKTKVSYTLPSGAVVEMSAWEAYQIDLARGILPGVPATYDPAYESLADNNNDGLPDWWQKLYDIYDLDPDDDPDNDGLSIYQEWQISWDEAHGFGVLNGYPFLSPTKARSGDAQEVTDYFLRYTNASSPYAGYYLGEIVADHDMMEDLFEDAFGTDDTLFDAWSDYDEDGWSAWSELRYSTFKMSKAGQFVSHNVGDMEVVDSPEPVIHATLRYNGEKAVGVSNTTFIVQAFAGNNMLKAPTASYVVKPGTAETRYYYLGMQENRVIHGTFTPGFLQAQKGSFSLEYAYIQPSSSYSWRVTMDGVQKEYTGTYEELRDAITLYGASLQLAVANFTWTPVNGGVAGTDGSTEALRVDVDDNTQKGYMSIDMERVGEIDFTTGDFTFDFSKVAGHYFNQTGVASGDCFYRIKYSAKLPTMQNKKLSLSLGKPTSGALVEGTTAFAAFIDLDGNGALTPGSEPFGFVKNVDIGWDNVPELIIELTDESAAGMRFAYPNDADIVRIIRTEINGKSQLDNGEAVKRRIVYSRDATTTDRKLVHEGDLVTTGKFGLDWANLRTDVEAMDGLTLKDVSSVTYTVAVGGGSVMNIDPTNVVCVITNTFPAEQSAPLVVSPAPQSGPIVETQRPVFKWTGTEDNTAFILQVLDTDETPVYTSPLQVLPARDRNGTYVWTAPVYVGTNACADAWSLDNNTNYSWRVAMFSPKFSNTNLETAVWSDASAFRTALAEGGSRTTVYGAADVSVRYFGPATNDLSSVLVQLFKTADFTGEPAAQSRLFDVDGKVELLTNNTYVVRFFGLEEGTYYALAYIDRNGDGIRQRSESWGYANQIGTGVEDIYTPVEVKVVSKSGNVPSAEIFMEDTDVNQNDIPDCLDDETILTVASATAGADTTDVDGDGLTADDETGDTYTDPSLWDSDGDGMPDGWEAMFAGTDPLYSDADTVINGDVMAYAEQIWKLVTDAAGNAYLLNPTNTTVHVGDDLSLSRLVSTYDYPVFTNATLKTYYGVGTNLVDEATLFRVSKVENVTAVLVHAQVYSEYGYNPLTAVPADDAVNTKPFTALDKYLLIRYFEALGLCTEADVNSTRAWADFSLMPNDADNDRDGVLDGWELYVMFGTNDVTTTLADAKISPFNYDDARTTAPATGSALTVLEEFDGGISPTDPWQTTTEGFTGLSDDIAYKFRIKSDADLLADPDNDGLSNWAEYLASMLTGEDFDVNDPCSVTPNRLDYFYQFKNPNDPDGVVKYIGESIDADYLGLIADHDFMEDFVEDTLGYNRYVYDANVDYDGNGWDNWSEVRARYNEATWVVVDKATNTYTRTFNSFTPEAKLQWRMWYDSEFKPKVSPISSGLINTLPSAWIFSVKYYDVNGEEKTVVSPNGQPVDNSSCEITWYEFEDKKAYGGHVAPNVNFTIYGIDAGETNVTIAAYTDKNLLTPDATLDRNGKVLSGSLKQGLNTFIVTSGAKTGFAKANVGFDRVDVEIALRADAIAFNVEPQTNTTTRVRVQRTAINGTSFAKPRTVYAKTMDLRNGKTFTEADLLKDGEYDFDQTYLVTDAEAAGVAAADIRSVSYAVYLDWGNPEPIYTFTRTFPAKLVAPAPSGATGQHGNVVEAARPTLAWQAPEGAVAFMLEIATDDAFGDIIYTTTNFMPIATAEGCQFKPDLYVGDGLDDATTYYWRVASVDAVTNSDWSATATFRTAVNVDNADTGYGRIAAEVRYFGPSPAALSDVVVGVYESADFTTEPVARKHLVGGDSVSTLTNDITKAFDVVSTNIVLDGIAPGTYYLMAFIDSNGNLKRDPWESWGYVNKIGTDATDKWTPVALTVKSTKATPPAAFLVIEDTDVNQNWTPDCLEDADLQDWTPASQIEPEEPSAADTDTDGDGLFDSEEDDYGTDPKNPDTDGDGLPDGFEVKVGSDPLFADSDLAGLNDVMAYKLDALKVMVTTNDAGEVTGRYVVNSRLEEGYEQQSNTVYTVFEVNGQLYVGAPTDRVDVTNAYAYAFMTNVVVMHSAVYDFYGYDPTTAKPGTVQKVAGEDGAETEQTVQGANTVPFTALLKYVTQEYYLKEFNGGDATNDFALAVNKLDSNANYLPDGYELYVRYATWHDPALTFDLGSARASYGDNAVQKPFDPYDQYFLYRSLLKSNPAIGGALAPFTNAEAIERGWLAADWDWNKSNPLDVMAYAEVTAQLAISNDVAYAVHAVTNEQGAVIATNLYRTVTLTNGTIVVGSIDTNATLVAGQFGATVSTNVVLLHSAVYDWFGFDPTTALPPVTRTVTGENGETTTETINGAHTVPFTAAWKEVTEKLYLKELFGIDFTLDPALVDSNANGLPDGWELYVGFAASTNRTGDAVFPLAGENLEKAIAGFNEGTDAADPWDEYFLFNRLADKDGVVPYTNAEARRYRIGDGDLVKDEDFDGLSNYQEFLASKDPYNVALDVMNAMSDGTTLDYFVKAGDTYLGQAFNGGEFIEPEARAALGMDELMNAGTRTDESGWTFWDEARYSYANVTSNAFENLVPAPAVSVLFRAKDQGAITVKAYSNGSTVPTATWTVNSADWVGTVLRTTLGAPETGVLLPGETRFTASNESGATGVGDAVVGWAGADVEIALGDANPMFPVGRSVLGADGRPTRARIVRTAINGVACTPRVVKSYNFIGDEGRTAFENGDFTTGLESKWLESDAAKLDIALAAVDTLTYTIVLGSENIFASTNGVSGETFTVNFAPARTVATPDIMDAAATIEGDDNTVGFTAASGMTKYWLAVSNDGGATWATNEVEALPAAVNGHYTVAVTNFTFTDGMEVAYKIALGNDKFSEMPTDDAGWSATGIFKVNNGVSLTGAIDVEVVYPAETETLTADNLIVGVSRTPDFREFFTTNATAASGGKFTATLAVETNRTYYVAAWYVKDPNDGRAGMTKMPYDTWGYATELGIDASCFDPLAVKADAGATNVVVYLQDTDWNANNIPDISEDFEAKTEGGTTVEGEHADDDADGDGLSYYTELDLGTDPDLADTDMDGIPDGYEVSIGSDPLFNDSGLAGIDDVMAYKMDNLKVMVTTNATDTGTITNRFVVNSRFEEGYAQQSNTVYRVFSDPSGQLYVGAPTNLVEVTNTYAYAYITNVVVMHSAVYDFYGYDPTTAKPGTVQKVAGEDGDETEQTVQGANTVPFTAFLKYVTQEFYLKEFDATNDFALTVGKLDSNANYLPDGYELYVRYATWKTDDVAFSLDDARASYGDNAAQTPYDPYDGYYWYKRLTELDPELAASLPPYDNAFAVTNRLTGMTAAELSDWWNWAPEDDYMAYVQTNVLISVVTNTDGIASIYAIDPGTNTLYETFYVGNELFVGAVCTNEYAYDAMENGDFMTMVTNATVIHSAVYDWYGFDPTTAKPSYFWPESIAYLAESNSNYTVGANSVPFTRRLKYITEMMYLPQVGAEEDYNLTTWWTDTNGNDMPDGWELYVKYTASSDPNKTDDDYKDDFDDGSDPNADDTDGDGIPDDVEQFFGVTDPTVKDADTVLENDVMAFANVNATVVTVQNTAEGSMPVKYLLAEEMAGNTVAAPKVGDDAASLALRATYEYLITAEDGSATNVCGVSTNVTLTAADGTTNRVVAVGVEPVVLVHAQVYDYFGFNPNTANTTAYAAGNAENTKLFTALDKYLVVRYLEAYDLAVATNDWKTLSLDPATSDGDADGVPDGWELYVMFGTEGITETIDAAKISPFNFDDARALAPAGDVTVIEKWNNGAPAYDPWSKDTNGNGIPDADEIKNGLSDLYGDSDNDQLPNFTEYLIGAGFTNYFGEVVGISATNSYSLTSLVTDYFRRVGKLYLGEMFTDHDFMEDLWEDRFHDVKKITRAYYDPWNDPDNDGWSNYAECRAGTDPTVGNSQGLSGLLVRNYPVPTIHATVVMGPGEGKLSGNLVVQAYSATSDLTGRPDAIWTVGFKSGESSDTNSGTSAGSGSDSSSDNSASEKSSYLGINPGRAFTFTLNPGSVTPGTVSMSFLDPSFEVHSITNDREVVEIGNINNAEWHDLVEDRPDGDMATGVMQVTTPTNSYAIGTIDYRTGQVTVDFAKLPSELRSPADGDLAKTNVVHLGSSYVRASWVASLIAGNTQATLQLGESDSAGLSDLGHVREGTNTFVVFVADADGTWKPGAPYGVVTGVDVGWSDAEFTVELTRTTPIMARFDLVSALSSGGSGSGSGSSGSGGGGSSDPTDRGLVNTGRGYAPNKDATYPGTNMPDNVTSLTRVRVVRNEINDTHVSNDVLLDRYFDLSVHPSLTESDLIAAGYLDLDWKTLNLAYNGRATPHKDLETATYRIVIGDDNTGGYVDQGEYENFGNNLPVLFVNKFEPKAAQTPTVPDPKLAEIVYSSRPTFRWSHTNSIDKAYPAFQLKIFAADKSTLVYDSGAQRAPARDESRMYEWTAPVYAGMVTPNGYVFNTTNNYYWSVSMLDAKFTAFNSSEAKTPFRLGTSGNLFDGKEHGSIAVCVKYFGPLVETGPLSASPATRKNLVRVQAFTSPDFSGTPVAEAYVTNVATIASEDVIATNALLRGVVRDGTYYVRAYIDTDANGVKSDWESWGYACWVGDPDVKSVWTPKPVTVSYTDMAPVATVFIEDADTDNDGFPDSWEMNKNQSLTTQGPISGDTFFAAVNPDLEATLNAYDKVASVFEGSGAENTLRGLPRLRSSSPQWVELLAGSESDLPVEATSVQIKSFSLENGLVLEVSNETTAGASNAITFNGSADVQLSLACATKPDFSDAVEVPIKSITIYANKTTDGVVVTPEELANARANVPEARFFKAIIKK